MATKLSGSGNISQFRDPNPKFLGIKISHGSFAQAGAIILKQRGNKYYAGTNVTQGRDFTLNSNINGTVVFLQKIVRKSNRKTKITTVSVIPVNNESCSVSLNDECCK